MSFIPDRNIDAITGSEFIKQNFDPIQRNINATKEILSGNFPDFLRQFEIISIEKFSYYVMKQYLAVGSNEDFIFIPLEAPAIQEICNTFDCSLPTVKMCNDIWKNSINKLNPDPWGMPYNSEMQSSSRITSQNSKIQKQFKDKNYYYNNLSSGYCKDIVLTNKLAPNNPSNRVAIYGWIQSDGKPIQYLNASSHELTYSDYSQFSRIISNNCIYDNAPIKLQDALLDPEISKLISDEGPLFFQKY